jgi:hypothetical protein
VDESAEAVATLDSSRGWTHEAELRRGGSGGARLRARCGLRLLQWSRKTRSRRSRWRWFVISRPSRALGADSADDALGDRVRYRRSRRLS